MPTSTTSQPAASSPHATACVSISPEARVSRPSTTRPPRTYVPNACAKEHASAGVRNSPTTPRIPDTPIFSRCSRRAMLSKTPDALHQRFIKLAWRIAALLADDAHDRLGLADAHVKPQVGPVHAQSVNRVRPSVVVPFAQLRKQRGNTLGDERHLPFQHGIFWIGADDLRELLLSILHHRECRQHGGDAVVHKTELRHHDGARALAGQRN